ncbi:hypothetical protein [Methylibium sp.]|uniref:hypothetical protein n=1 Tax=Methylibium sp. TaxID=2067992 RepID=UPI003D0D4277
MAPGRRAAPEPQPVRALVRQTGRVEGGDGSLWQADRTRRINTLRGYCREFGIAIAQGARLGLEQIARVLAEPHGAIPELLRPTCVLLVEEVLLRVRPRCGCCASTARV